MMSPVSGRPLIVALACCAAVAAAAACVDSGPGPQPKKIDPQYVASHVLDKAPADLERWDVALGDALVYLGNKVDKTRVAPGQPVTITHYWQAKRPIDARWRPFGLVRGPANTEDFMNLQLTDMQIARPPSSWKPNEIIEDVQVIVLRPDWRSAEATVLVGLIEQGGHGPLDRMAATGEHTRDRAIVARVLEVDLARAVRPGTIHIPRAMGAIAIDGLGTDVGWSNAVTSPELVTGEGSVDPAGKAIAKMTWDDEHLYVFVSVTDPDIVTPYTKHDDTLWKADCIELFIDADGNRSGYIELQVNPNNATFDSWFATTRAQPGDVSWESNMVTAVKLRGTTEGGDADIGWDVEMAIPWEAVKGRDANMKVRLPPRVGDRFRLNLVRVDKRAQSEITWSSWNRIANDFHGLDRMLVAIFADPTGSTTPVDEPTPCTPGTPDCPTSGQPTPGPGSGSAGADSANAGLVVARAGRRVVVAVPATGEVTFDGKRLLDDDLEKVLRIAVQADKGLDVAFEVAGAAQRDRVSRLVEQAKRAGVTRLAITTK
ncbi:MAG: hypothetical protein KF773_40045 [Deltaproteobacteria bacterium]|nr:hypothetical protein [Deltaproteobacteria bacterium]